MSFQMYDGLVTVNVDKTPLALNESENISPAAHPNKKMISAGIATRNRNSLKYQEAHRVVAGVVHGQAGRLLNERVQLSEADRDLTHEASDVVTTRELKDTHANAGAVKQKLSDASVTASTILNDDDQRNIRYAMHVSWQEHVLSLAEAAVCGLVILIPDVPK
ncbi:uncharacterized protein N7500_005161 [Penicillium coprophilum]|uniref:uncharacterized protein n=1 Tax=Penicillium coprophilum TaxID=36646 RepID=UPI0023A58D5F|nr:uncharacterized protein N7500_005161 [Penicillium coprophilum]KAJ5163331.1 hypothetical protein N7500_005161 [Penicillium coprophilum]